MTPQEEQLLNSLVERVNSTQLQEKDPDAEALLNKSLGTNPDALYILAQTTLVQNIALEQARAQVAQLQQAQQQAPQPARATSFLGSLLGHHDPAPAPQPAVQPGWSQVPQQQVYAAPAPPPVYAQPQYQQAQYAPPSSGAPSFLRGAAQTAAGVAAGALAFEGVESILHGLGGMGHPGFGFGGVGNFGPGMGGGFERPEETVINNYYDEPGRGGEERHHESGEQFADSSGAQYSDASYNTSGDDQGSYDDQSYDNSGQDDSSSYDDGGGGGGGDLL